MTLLNNAVSRSTTSSWIDDSTWSDANFGVKLMVPTPIKRLFLTPAIYYSKALNKDLGAFDDHFYGGVGIVTKLF